ncbi:MAG: RNA 2',3'-cyclic phosphodiesterase [Acidobacteria bacterium]|nr:RNA 2',3'-cyclic phosphodiesterase [Acidobacteriota bacterium]
MRLFVAFEIPEPVRREVRRRVAGLRERLPRARWVNPDVLHLTLLFMGEVAPERVTALAGRLGEAFAPFPPMPLRLAGAGTFPAGRPARVAWIGVSAPPELVPLQAAVARAAREVLGPPASPAATSAASETPETSAARAMPATPAAADTPGIAAIDERPYRPHVTLARCPAPWPRGAAEKFTAAFPGEIGPPFLATMGVLVESKLSPKGPRYRDLEQLPLAGAAGDAGDATAPGEVPAPGEAPALAADRPAGAER